VFIKNLPWSATDEELANFFGECGEVTEVRIGAPLGLKPLITRAARETMQVSGHVAMRASAAWR